MRTLIPYSAITQLARRDAALDPIPPRSLRPDLPPALQAVILRGMARLPARRYSSVLNFIFELTHLERVDVAAAERAFRTAPRRVRMPRWLAYAALTLLPILLFALLFLTAWMHLLH